MKDESEKEIQISLIIEQESSTEELLATTSDPGEHWTPGCGLCLDWEIEWVKLLRIKNDKICDIVYSALLYFIDVTFISTNR